ncbi:uncharacterized protein METZ01_LOCUS365983, partial [marine metagenome]
VSAGVTKEFSGAVGADGYLPPAVTHSSAPARFSLYVSTEKV